MYVLIATEKTMMRYAINGAKGLTYTEDGIEGGGIYNTEHYDKDHLLRLVAAFGQIITISFDQFAEIQALISHHKPITL